MSQETVRHVLGVAVRIDDHFIAEPIGEELDVRVDTFLLPTQVRDGSGRRHADGTYRFLDLADGAHQLTIASPDERWMTLDPLPTIVTPVAQPTQALIIEAWPTPLQSTPLGMTAIRGKLAGAPGATIAQRIQVGVGSPAVDTGHFTETSSLGEFLFLLPGHLELDADSLVPVTVTVAGHAITGGQVIEGEQHTPFPAAAFRIVPGRETRVVFHVT